MVREEAVVVVDSEIGEEIRAVGDREIDGGLLCVCWCLGAKKRVKGDKVVGKTEGVKEVAVVVGV